MSDSDEPTPVPPPEVIEGSFVLSPEDAGLFDLLNKGELLVITFQGQFLLMLAAFLPAAVALALAQRPMALTICCVVFLALTLWYWWWYRNLLVEQQRQSATFKSEIHFRLSSDRIEYRFGEAWQCAAWDIVREIRTTETHILIFLHTTEWVAPCGTGYLIPYRAFSDRAAGDRCLEFCLRQFAAAQSKVILEPSLEIGIAPPAVQQELQETLWQLEYQYSEAEKQTLDATGNPPRRGVIIWLSVIVVLSAAILLLHVGLAQVGELERIDILHGAVIGCVSMVCFWIVFRRLWASFYDGQLPPIVNPRVKLVLTPTGLYLSTGYSLSFTPGTLLPPLADRRGCLMMVGMDLVVRRTIPRQALGSEENVRRFIEAYEATREGRVVAQAVNRVPPSDNPYRPPENE